jgi:hypothetical protein
MTIGRCDSCDSRLAHDQRYCLECGARRGALPHYVAASIAGILERGERIVARRAPRRETAAPGFEPDPTRWHEIWLRAPRAAAATVIATLSFGGLIGSLVGNSAAGTASQVIVAMAPGTHAASAGGGAGSVAGGGGDGGGSGGPATITVTTPAPSTPAPSGSGVGGGATTPTTGATTPVNTGLPPIKHVFLVMLSQEGYNQTFGASSSDPYLARTLTHQGELVPNYYAVAGSPLANEIALVSGQGPTPSTEADCPLYQQVLPGSAGRRGQVVGDGCEYPAQTQTLASQLNAVHLATKTYVQPAGPAAKVPRAESCRPGFAAPTSAPSVKKPYAAWQNPFLYFTPSGPTKACSPDVAGIAQLRKDLRSAKTTPALSYIVPNLCDDGAMACQPQPKTPVQAMDRFLQTLVPEIKHSPAYEHGGVIVITFDEAPQTGQYTDPSSCCNNPKYPNLKGAPPPGPGSSSSPTGTTTGATTTDTSTTDTTTTGTTTTPTTPTSSFGGQTNPTGGGGHVGLLLISRYVTPGTLEVTDYFNHFSLLASLEDVFALKRLGYASVPTLPVFGAAVWNNYKPH